MKKQKFTVQDLAKIGVMAAVVFVTTKFISIPIPIGMGKTAIHFGNVMCILAGLLFGAVPGGLAAGIGSMVVDLTDPLWAPEFWVTFLFKFTMAFIAGTIAGKAVKTKAKVIIAAVVGSLSYVALYLAKTFVMQYYILGNPMETTVSVLITKGATSIVNALLAMVISVILYYMIEPALKRTGITARKD